jgi:hypothetical protein
MSQNAKKKKARILSSVLGLLIVVSFKARTGRFCTVLEKYTYR